MNFSKDELRRGMHLNAVTVRSWLKKGQALLSVCRKKMVTYG